MNIVAIRCRTNTGEESEIPVAELFDAYSSGGVTASGTVPKSDGKKYIASGISVNEKGEIYFKNYDKSNAVTGIAQGLIAFDANGRLITIPLDSKSSGKQVDSNNQSPIVSQSTEKVLPFFIDNNGNLGDTDIINDSGNYSIGGPMAFWKWDVSGSVNVAQNSDNDGYRINGKLVVSFDSTTGELTIGNATYTTTNIKHIKTDSATWNATGGGTIKDIAEATASDYILTKPAETGTYATREWTGINVWKLDGNNLGSTKKLGSTNNQDWELVHTNTAIATIKSTGLVLSNLTANYIPKHTAAGLVNSQIFDNGTNVTINGIGDITWGAGVNSFGFLTIGNTSATGASLFVQTPSLNNSFHSGFGVDGTYASQKSTINLKAFGVKSGGGYTSEMAFHTSFEDVLYERVRINHTGVGIGTNSPSYKLDVTGTGHFTGSVMFDTVPSSLQDATTSNHLVRYSQWIGATYLKPYTPVVKTVSFTSLTKSGLYAINGYTPTAGEYVLDAFGDTGSGIWSVDSGAWTRPSDANEDLELRGFIVSIQQGTYAGYKYLNTNTSAITINTTPITYTEWSNNIETDPLFTAWSTASRTANTVFAAPSGSNGTPTWRVLTATDIPSLDWTKITTGKPTTLAGYGILDAQPLDSDLTAIAALTGTNAVLVKAGGFWVLDTATYLSTDTLTSFKATTSMLGLVVAGPTMEINGLAVINQKSGIVAVGTYRSVTVDTYGRVTAGTNPTTLAGYGITDAYTKTESNSFFGGKQDALSGVGYVKSASGTISYDDRQFVDTTTLQSSIAGQKTFIAPFVIIPDGAGTSVTVTSYTNNGVKIPRINASVGILGDATSALSFYALNYYFKGGNLKLGGSVGVAGSIANIADATERLDVDGNIRYTTLLKPNNVAGSNGQVLSTNGTQDIWKTLTVSDISNISSTYQSILPSGTAGQFLIRNASNIIEWSTLELEPIPLSNNKIAVGDSANYLSEYSNFQYLDGRYISIHRESDSTKSLLLGMDFSSNNSFVSAVGGRLTLRGDSGIYLNGFTGVGNKMVIVNGEGKLDYTEIPSGGSTASPLSSSFIGYGSTINTLTGNSTFTYLDNRYIHFSASGSDFNIGTTGTSGFVESVAGNLILQARSSFGVVVDDGFLKVNDLAGTGTRMVTVDSTGKLESQAIPSGSGVPGLTATQIAYGSGSNLLTSSANFAYDNGSLVLTNTTAANTNVIRINGSDGYDKNIFFAEVGATNNGAFVGYRAGVSGAPDPTMLVMQTVDANNVMGGIAIHRQNGHVYIGLTPNAKAWNSTELNSNKLFVDGNMRVGGNEIIISGTSFKLSFDDAWGGTYTPSIGDKCVLTYNASKSAFVIQRLNAKLFQDLVNGDTVLTT
jgi:hypothetical protein